jgi:hypothetical protein
MSKDRINELELKLQALDFERSQIIGEILTIQAAVTSGNLTYYKTPGTPEEKQIFSSHYFAAEIRSIQNFGRIRNKIGKAIRPLAIMNG